MGGRERTGRIGSVGVSSQEQGLAAASAKILGTLIATAARLRHPVFSAEALEGRRVLPDIVESPVANIFKSEARNDFGGVARKNLPRGIDEHQPPSPPSHAGLGKARVVIGDDKINTNAPG